MTAAAPRPPRSHPTAGERVGPRVARLTLQDFRTYPSLDLAVGAPVVALVGENGAGKTNLLEALSLFGPGRGLRRADLGELACRPGAGGFSVGITLDTPYGEHRLGTGLEAVPSEGRAGRICRVD